MNRAKKAEARSNFQLWLVGLNNRADNCDIDVLGADIVGRRYHGNVDICTSQKPQVSALLDHTISAVDLILRNDDLAAV